MAAVIKALNTIQEDEKKKRWSYTWHGEKVIIVERLGKIPKTVEKYLKVGDITIQSHPEVAAPVWGAIRAVLQVCV